MHRADKDLAFMLQYENIAWYDFGRVRILDRRVYPTEIKYVTCTTYEQVALAIKNMVTQSYGPYYAAAMGMTLAAYQARSLNVADYYKFMEKAKYELSHARPTTSKSMSALTEKSYAAIMEAKLKGKDPVSAGMEFALDYFAYNYTFIERTAMYLVDKIPKSGTVMTQCFGETIVGMMLKECRIRGNEIKLICPETRPYLQGSRLTASVSRDMGFETTVITDNMPGYVLKKKNVDVFTSAADVITLDGNVINKIGTFQIALAAKYYNIPYYVTGEPDPDHPDADSVEIEERQPEQTLGYMGKKVTMDGVQGYYPAFDITPPELVTGVVTRNGIYAPDELRGFFDGRA